ncbi:hypothetical protein BGT96224_4458 [Blumeria graminis f. sp. tritici 96224]|uniref:Uncharacterized protein n=1 Tax=Blumeria graminis f. sp. tritici 96224 TaxID=1268274 RepID=A0A656KM25_BLUGR|nr:hypothetical protein BGT96224_4458 [Blumeria graminis f. sp. tritici 96224]
MSHHFSLVPQQSHAIPSHLIPQPSPHPHPHPQHHPHSHPHLQSYPYHHPQPHPQPHPQQPIHTHPNSPPLVASVSHLSSATSLYASLLLPLSIQLIHTNHHTQPTNSSFGLVHCYPPQQILNLTQAPQYFPIQLTHIFLPAPNPQALRDFWGQCELLIPGTVGHIEKIESGERCCLRDYDGNLIEVHWSMQPIEGITVPAIMNMDTTIPYHSSRDRELKYYPPRQRDSTRHRERARGDRDRLERDRVERDRKERDRCEREKGGRESNDRNRGDRDRRDRERDSRNRDRGRQQTFPLGSSSFPSAMPPDKDTRRVLQWQKDVARSISLPDEDYSSDDSDEHVDRKELPPICAAGHPYSDTPCRERRGRDKPSAPDSRIPQRAGSYPKDFDRERESRRLQDRPKVGRRETVADMERSREYTNGDSRSKPSSRIQGKQVLGSLIGGAATAAVVYGMINSRPESPPPVSKPRYRHSYAHNSQSDPFAYRSSNRRRNHSVGNNYTIADHKGIQMIDREVWAARRDSGIGGMSGVSSGGDRVDEQSSSSGTRQDSYKTGPKGSRLSEELRYHYRDSSNRRERGRDGEFRNRYSRPLTILPAAPEPGSESSESSESDSTNESESACESESEREIERERVRNRQKRRARIEKELQSEKKPESDVEDRERPLHDRPTAQAEDQGFKQDSSYASAKPYHSPTLSVISQSLSSTSGSTLKAEREIISKVPTPPSAMSPRIRSSSHPQRERDWIRYPENETTEYYTDRHRGYEPAYEYSAAPPVTGPSYSSHHHSYRRSTRATREVPPSPSGTGYEYPESVSPGDSVSSADSNKYRRRRTQKHRR